MYIYIYICYILHYKHNIEAMLYTGPGKMILVVNSELKMGKGKIAAQVQSHTYLPLSLYSPSLSHTAR
jgi:hypothetical protein